MSIARVVVEPAVAVGAVSRTPDEGTREARATQPEGPDGAGLNQARAGGIEERFADVADMGKAGPSLPMREGPVAEDHGSVHVRGRCGVEHEAQGGGSVQREHGAPTEGPGMHPGAAEALFASKEASLRTGQATTMASAATFLLTRGEAEKRDLPARLTASRVYTEQEAAVAREVGAHAPSPITRHALEVSLSGRGGVEAGTEREGRALWEASAEGELQGGSRGVTVEDERRRPVGAARLSPSEPTGLQVSPGTQETAPVTLLTGEWGAASGPSNSIQPEAQGAGKSPEALPSPSHREHNRKSPAQARSAWAECLDPATAGVEKPIASVDRKSTRPLLSAPAGDRSPAAARQRNARQGDTERNVSDVGSTTGGTGVAEGEGGPGVDGGGERSRSEDATERLLREALRVKGLLARMDRTDASTGGDGLRDEDPERFLAGLGLVELKPLAGRLAEALERTPQALLGDPAVAVPEPRTARGLRDQVTCVRVCCRFFGLFSISGDDL